MEKSSNGLLNGQAEGLPSGNDNSEGAEAGDGFARPDGTYAYILHETAL